MRTVGIKLYRYALPLARPLALGGRAVCGRDGVLIRLESDDGRLGWGDAVPLPGYSRESIVDVERELARLGRRRLHFDLDDEASGVPSLRGVDAPSPSVVFGLETALAGLAGGGDAATPDRADLAGFRGPVSVNGLLDGTREEILEDVRTLMDLGYRTLKLKLGRRPFAADVELTHTVRRLVGGRAALRLDANRAWSLREAVRFGKEIGAEGIAYLEEPLTDPAGLPAFFDATGVPVALDESLRHLEPRDLEGRADVAAVILKPTLLGGVDRARRWAQQAIASQILPVISASFESGIGILGLARLASLSGCADVAAGLDTYRWLARDVVTPRLRFERGALYPTARGGRVYELDFRSLREVRYG